MNVHRAAPLTPLRIAILTHSPNPRGGVVHALCLGDALTRMGHKVTVLAPGARHVDFFRAPLCETQIVPASPVSGSLTDLVEARIADLVSWFETPERLDFDIFHCGDGITGNALATLKRRGLVPAFSRTVHHMDVFENGRLDALQERSIREADELFVVSRFWRGELLSRFGRQASVVGNGVDRSRFSPQPDDSDARIAARIGAKLGPTFLSIGGVEERKNSIRALEAFAAFLKDHPSARWLIAGGASILDHGAYAQAFREKLAALKIAEGRLVQLGPMAEDDVAALMRAADVLLFPSINEGFGLVVLEAMACGAPVVTSRIAPFTEYLEEEDAAWCNPLSSSSIAEAMRAALQPETAERLVARGFDVADRHDWRTVALAHMPVFSRMKDLAHA